MSTWMSAPPSATETAVPLSLASDRATPGAVALAPQLAVPSTRMSLADGGETHVTGAATAVEVPSTAPKDRTAEVAATAAAMLAWLVPVLWPNSGVSITELRWVILVLGFNVAVSILGCVFGGVLIGLQRFELERAFVFSSGVVRFVLTLLVLQKEWGLLILALITLATTLAENLGYVACAFRLMPSLRFGPRHFRRRSIH